MFRLISTLGIALAGFVISTHGETYYSIANGTWTNPAIWSFTQNGANCNCVPQGSDNVQVSHTITLDKRLTNGNASLGGVSGHLNILSTGNLNGGSTFNLDVLSQGRLTVCGRLTVNHIEFFNGSNFNFCSGSTIQVNGNFINRNNSPNIVVDGNVTITGSFENGTGAVIAGSGSFLVNGGPAINNGTLFSCIGQYPCSAYPCYISAWCGSSTTLPVEWVSFKAIPEGKGMMLEWSTATESNSDNFQVQSSSDGLEFMNIGHVPASGFSNTLRHYSFYDGQPGKGEVYYRIKQTDFDGSFLFSEIIHVRTPEFPSFELFPNPVSGNKITFRTSNSIKEQWRVRLFDFHGRIMLDASGITGSSSVIIELPEGVGPGCYSMVVDIGTESRTERLMIAP